MNRRGSLAALVVAPLLLIAAFILTVLLLLQPPAQECGPGLTGPDGEPRGAAVGNLGGVAGTGITPSEVAIVRSHPLAGSTFTSGSFLATAYGPPWGGIQGEGIATAGGLRINGGAPHKYFIAVDPSVIGLGQWVYVWPNPFKWRGPFLAADTGGAILGRHIDFYDWRGRAYQLQWNTQVRVSSTPMFGPDVDAPVGTGRTPATGSGPVLNVGDSLAVGSGPALARLLSGRSTVTRARESRTSSQAVADLRAMDRLPPTVVVQLGTNDSDVATFRSNVAEILAMARRDSATIFWVNIARPPLGGTTAAELNTVLAQTAQANANFKVIDWRAAVQRGAVELADGVHPTAAGYETRATLIADVLRGSPAVAAAGACASDLSGGGNPDARALLDNPNITFANPAAARADLMGGRISPRLIALMSNIAGRHKYTVTALASDHAPGTNHEAGRAVDIAIVDGDNCVPPDKSGGCWELAQELDRIEGCFHSTELIYYFDPGPSPDSFAATDHDDHIHTGFDGPLGPKHYNPGTPPCSDAAINGSGAPQ